MLRALWPRVLDVRVTESPPVSRYRSPRVGTLFAAYLSGLGFGGGHALSALPLVRGVETAPRRSVAQLFLNSTNKPMRTFTLPLQRTGGMPCRKQHNNIRSGC